MCVVCLYVRDVWYVVYVYAYDVYVPTHLCNCDVCGLCVLCVCVPCVCDIFVMCVVWCVYMWCMFVCSVCDVCGVCVCNVLCGVYVMCGVCMYVCMYVRCSVCMWCMCDVHGVACVYVCAMCDVCDGVCVCVYVCVCVCVCVCVWIRQLGAASSLLSPLHESQGSQSNCPVSYFRPVRLEQTKPGKMMLIHPMGKMMLIHPMAWDLLLSIYCVSGIDFEIVADAGIKRPCSCGVCIPWES